MNMCEVDINVIKQYKQHLFAEEKSNATINKYMRDIQSFYEYLPQDKLITKERLVCYKQKITEKYKITTVNSILVALNQFLVYLKIADLKLKLHRIQKKAFMDEEKVLSKQEYTRLLHSARSNKNEKLYLLLQTICATGIRVSEHKYITVNSLYDRKATIVNKGKVREIYIEAKIRKLLLKFCKKNQITTGSIFVTRTGKPLDRSNIWSSMKALCKDAKVDSRKVFPHNLRHLFAITYYKLEKDLDTLASLLGHSSIETTRIYTKKSGFNCIRSLNRMQLVE